MQCLRMCILTFNRLLQLESVCLAKYTDGVWYKGKVVDLHEDGRYTVMFDSYDDETHEVTAEDIIPAGIIFFVKTD